MRLLACALGVLLLAAPVQAQAPDPVTILLQRVEAALTASDRAQFATLFADSVPPPQVEGYLADLLLPGAIRTTVRERDRAPLEGAPEGDGYRLVVEFFIQTAGKARILTASMDLRRPSGGGTDSWRIVTADGLTSVEGIYKLRLNTAKPLVANGLEIRADDLVLTLLDGTLFLVECDDGPTGAVFVGRGEVRFTPTPVTERGQLRLFAGSDSLVSTFDRAFLRINPGDFPKRVATAALAAAMPQPRVVRNAQEVFARESGKSYTVDLQDLSTDTWHLLPQGNDFLAEIDTRRFDLLTYSRASAQAEDISVFQREDQRTIALYPSAAKLAARGRFYSDDVLRDFDVVDYNVDVSVLPDGRAIEGRARLAIRVRSTSLSNLMLRLADPLVVTGVTSVEYGRLLHLRLRGQNAFLINLPRSVPQDSDLTLVVTYTGRLPSQEMDVDTIAVAAQERQDPALPLEATAIEPHFLLSNRSFWYPQNPIPDYATATIRVTVPAAYRALASGEPISGTPVISLRDLLTMPNGNVFAFRANQPLRYLALLVSRLQPVARIEISVAAEAGNSDLDKLTIAVETHPRQQARGRALARPIEDMLRFYTSLVGDAPFPSTTIALVESVLPGGHSPGYFAVLNNPVDALNTTWRNDPASFDSFPEFFLAHELAHQWWGQAVGWKNYHEQWLSEGFSQYFAALYAQKSRGDRVFNDMLRQFRRWSLSESDQGPIYLGYRLGHIKSDLRVFRAVVYNKGAAVLHMLRRLLGDEVFFNGIRRFYMDRRYQKAGTDDFQRAMEAVSGRPLDRFFERWIYGVDIPVVRYSSTIADRDVLVRFEQTGELVFDLPVTVTLTHTDGRTTDVVVPLTEKIVEQRIAAESPVRQVHINRDNAALAEFDD